VLKPAEADMMQDEEHLTNASAAVRSIAALSSRRNSSIPSVRTADHAPNQPPHSRANGKPVGVSFFLVPLS